MKDHIGHKTLDIMAQARHYNQWVYSIISPFLKGQVAEVGAGTGTFSDMISKSGFSVTAIDHSPEYLKIISKKNKNIKTFLFDMQAKSIPPAITGKFDSVIILNVLEHLSDHTLAISHLYKMLKRGGLLIALVPSVPAAFGSMDAHLGHFRRYTKKTFTDLAISSGFQIISSSYINMLGLLGWFVNTRLLGSEIIPDFQVKIFDIISRPFLFIEKLASPPVGLSLICVIKKP